MEIKVLKPHLFAPLVSPDNKSESRGMQVVHYLTRTISGNTTKDTNNIRERTTNGMNSDRVTQESTKDDDSRNAHGEHTHRWGISVGKSVLETSKGVASDLKGGFVRLSDKLLEKLSAMPTIPAESLENARRAIESIVSEATHSAYGKTRDVMLKIRVRLVEIIPSLSPQESKKIVDDVQREVLDSGKTASSSSLSVDENKPKKEMPQSNAEEPVTTRSTNQPQLSMLATSMDRIKSWGLFRSRL